MISQREAKAHIDEMLNQRKPFGEIESFIDNCGLQGPVQMAAWLYAWSQQPRVVRNEIVLVILEDEELIIFPL